MSKADDSIRLCLRVAPALLKEIDRIKEENRALTRSEVFLLNEALQKREGAEAA